MVAHRRTSLQVATDAQEGLNTYRLRRRIPIAGILDATGKPGEERIRMFQVVTEDIAVDVVYDGNDKIIATEAVVVEHDSRVIPGTVEVVYAE